MYVPCGPHVITCHISETKPDSQMNRIWDRAYTIRILSPELPPEVVIHVSPQIYFVFDSGVGVSGSADHGFIFGLMKSKMAAGRSSSNRTV